MLIAHILTRLLQAGAEENTLQTAAGQQADGHRVVIIFGADFDQGLAARARERFETICEPSLLHAILPARDLLSLARLVRTLRRLRPDVVHTHQSKAGVLGRLAAKLAGAPVIVHGVHILPWVQIRRSKRWIYLAAERLCARFTHMYVDVSPAVRDECLARGIGRPERHRVALSPMPIARFRDASWPDDWRDIVGGSEKSRPVVLMLAAFEPRKRQLAFLHALAERAGSADLLLLFAGEGPERRVVEAAVRRLGWEERVRFLGHRPDPERLIALADICVLTSVREGLPRVVVQYLTGGRPVVATRVPGLEDVVTAGRDAVVVDTVQEAAGAVLALAADPARRARMAAEAARADTTRWSAEHTYPQMRAAYQAALEQAGRAR